MLNLEDRVGATQVRETLLLAGLGELRLCTHQLSQMSEVCNRPSLLN